MEYFTDVEYEWPVGKRQRQHCELYWFSWRNRHAGNSHYRGRHHLWLRGGPIHYRHEREYPYYRRGRNREYIREHADDHQRIPPPRLGHRRRLDVLLRRIECR